MNQFNYEDYLKCKKWMKQKIISGVAEDGESYQLEKTKVNQPHDKLLIIICQHEY